MLAQMPPISRITAEYTPSNNFTVLTKVYTQQYAGIYFTRLNCLRQRVLSNVKWTHEYVPKLLDVLSNKTCYIVGTVYNDMPLKPSYFYLFS
jgi:DNA polymerase delta subunit 2